MGEQLSSTLLDRYLAGEATSDERLRVERWIEEVPERAQLLRMLRQDRGGASPSVDVEAAWQRVAARLQAHEKPARPVRSRAVHATRWLLPMAAALLIAASLTIWRTGLPTGGSASKRQSELAFRELTTPNGRRASLLLADGSRVVLNAGSRLRYAEDFGRAGVAREVHLNGEAYFEVTHDATRPFRVHAGPALAEDLGTRFSVRAYAGAPSQVVVAEGRVSLRDNTAASPDGAILGPGQRGRLALDGSPTSGTVVVDAVNPQRYLSWTSGTLTLDDIPLREAVPILERWFDIELRLADSTLADRRVTAVYHDQPLSQVLDALALALGARYERSAGNTRAVTFFAVRRGS